MQQCEARVGERTVPRVGGGEQNSALGGVSRGEAPATQGCAVSGRENSVRVSVVVVNYNGAHLLTDCLRSLLRQTVGDLEVIVVDNASTDNSLDIIRSHRDDRINLVCSEENRGFAGGCNLGIREARSTFVALLNNDAVAEVDWLENLLGAMVGGGRLVGSGRLGMCASKILFDDSQIIDKAGHLIFPDGQNRGRGTGEVDLGQYDRMEETVFPDGCAALYRREVLEEVGGFDEDFFAYGDDADLGLRAQWLGWRCLYVPTAVVHHRHSSTSGRFSPQKVFWVERNRFWLVLKCFPLPLLLLAPLFSAYRILWNLVAALASLGAAGNFRQENSFWILARTIIRAYVEGFALLPRMLRKRRFVLAKRRLSSVGFYRLLWRFRVSARVLAVGDRPNP